MKYLFFDIECCDGRHICSFGYVIADENLNILEKEDMVMSPMARFNLYGSGIELAYTKSYFYRQEKFDFYYERIKELLLDKETVVLGHSVKNDIYFLDCACKDYNLPLIKVDTFDTQNFYRHYNLKYPKRSLDNIVEDLGINIEHLTLHKSCDDAEMSLLCAKTICENLGCNIKELIELCGKDEIEQNKMSAKDREYEKEKRKFLKKVKAIADNYPDRENWPKISISDTIKITTNEDRIELVEELFEKGYNYVSGVKSGTYFVTNGEKGKKDLYIEEKGIEESVKRISIEEFSEIIDLKLDENCNIIRTTKDLLLSMKKHKTKAKNKTEMELALERALKLIKN